LAGFESSRYVTAHGLPEPKPERDFRSVDFAREARSVLDRAVARGAVIERTAYEEGFAKGEAAGVDLGKQQMMPFIDRLEEMLGELAGARKKMLMDMEEKIVALSIDIAGRIVHKAVARDDGIVCETVKEALAQSVDRGRITLHVSPSVHGILEELRPELLKIKDVEEVLVVADAGITPGGCLIETSNGVVDARVETALNEVQLLISK
jgi:flagellar assembly protein FliH